MPYLNKCQIMGHAGKSVEFRQSQDGEFATFPVAVSNGKDKKPEWFNCIAWYKQAEWCKGIGKGDLVLVEGKVSLNRWQTKEGVENCNLQITVYDVKQFKKPPSENVGEPLPF